VDFVIEFNPDAFKHGITEADIRRAFDTAVYDGLLDEADDDARDKYLLINVFHAMPCRSIYNHLLSWRNSYGNND